MPIKIMKGAFDYALKNKWFFLLIILLSLMLEISLEVSHDDFAMPLIILFFVMGYGLQVTHDVINDGVRLPKILPKKLLGYSFKGFIVFFFYILIQVLIMFFITDYLHFPDFDLEDLILNFGETIHLFQSHDLVSFVIFVVSGFVVVYVTTFFMELALAKLADGGRLIDAFNFPRIKHAIDTIGWMEYTIDYTKILLAIIFLLFINEIQTPNVYLNIIVGTITDFFIFLVEYRGIGRIYKIYTDRKKSMEETSV